MLNAVPEFSVAEGSVLNTSFALAPALTTMALEQADVKPEAEAPI